MNRLTAALLAGPVLIAIGLAGCSSPAPEDDVETVVQLAGDFPMGPNFTPGVTIGRGDTWGESAVYDPLLIAGLSPTDISPNVITDWSYDDDRTVLSLTVREGLSFTDGTPLDAEAVAANIEFNRTPPAAQAVQLRAVTGVTVTGDLTLDVELSQPDVQVLQGLAGILVASPDSLEDPEAAALAPVGSGPYVLDLENTTFDVEYTFVRNEDYWNPDDFAYDTVVLRIMPDLTARINALKSGQLDVATIDAPSVDQMEGDGFTVLTYPRSIIGLYFADRAGEIQPAIADVRVREAICKAFNRDETVESLLNGHGFLPSNQSFLDAYPAYVDDLDDDYCAYDPEGARELMAEAGYADGFDLLMPSWGFFNLYEPMLTQSFADIGIRVTFETLAVSDALANIQAGKYPVYTYRFAGSGLFNFVREGGVFTGDHPDATATELLAAAEGSDDETAEEAFEELGTYLLDNYWFSPYATPAWATAANPEVSIGLSPGGVVSLDKIRPAD